jgi:hypothetical protein
MPVGLGQGWDACFPFFNLKESSLAQSKRAAFSVTTEETQRIEIAHGLDLFSTEKSKVPWTWHYNLTTPLELP